MRDGSAPGPMSFPELTAAEQRLRILLAVGAAFFAALGLSYLVMGFWGGSEYPFVANSLAKDGLFALLCLIGAADVRRFAWTAVAVAIGHGLIVLGLVLEALFGHTSSVAHTLAGPHPSAGLLLGLWAGAAAAVSALLLVFHYLAERERFGLRYLSPVEFRTLAALAEVLVCDERQSVAPEQVAHRVDVYLRGFRARRKSAIRLALLALSAFPLFSLRPPYWMMSPASRLDFVDKRFRRGVWTYRVLPFLRPLVQAMIRAGQQMAFLGFYGTPEAQRVVGYVPFSARPEYEHRVSVVNPDRPEVHAEGPRDVRTDTIGADVVIVGSGAAGAILAHRLAKHHDRDVLVLERGLHVRPRDFTEDEPTQLSNLYADGALQMSSDFRFSVAQGMCVGGSTVVNNGVCFELPERVLDRWLDHAGLHAGLEPDELRAAFARVKEFLYVAPVQPDDRLNPGWRKFREGVDELGLTDGYGIVDCNITDCLGCGYCNIGCAFGKKLSALDNILPRAQREAPGRVRVLAECRADRIEGDGRRARAVRCTLGDGRRISVKAETVIVSAGAIASSRLLQDSGIGGRNVGRHLGFNIASPMTAVFAEELHSERGLQISHYLEPPTGDGFALETWFNPVVTQSLFMPGWFEQHRRNMLDYARSTCVGAVVGSERNGIVRKTLNGPFDYSPTDTDRRKLVQGLQLAARICLAADAERVMPATFNYHELRDEAAVERLERTLADPGELSINSAHPQGGNPVSADSSKGVVDPAFRVWGYENLHVCDASVFPAPITVNPQLTVMALADYAAAHVR